MVGNVDYTGPVKAAMLAASVKRLIAGGSACFLPCFWVGMRRSAGGALDKVISQ